jgi:hypothetical protein
MPHGEKFRKLRSIKLRPDGRRYDISEIATAASRLYRDHQIFQATTELRAAGASMNEIERVCEEIRNAPDVVNRQYLSELNKSRKKNPPFNIIEALSLFFGVETDYWRIGPDATERTRELERQVELAEIGGKVLRAAEKLTEGSQEGTQGMAMIGALLRGLEEKDPAQVEVILRTTLYALQAAPEAETG